MILIYENKFGKAEYDEPNKIVRTQYIGIANTEAIIDYLSKVITYSETHPIKHGVTNLSQLKGTFTGAMDFIEGQFYPKMIQNGLLTYAMVISNDVFTKFSADQLTKKIEGKLDWQIFSDINEAEEWTCKQIKKNSLQPI
jgi:hypothetical protein